MPPSAAQTALPSRLARLMRVAIYAAAAVVVLTGAFLAGPARGRADVWTAALVLLHLGLGALLTPICLIAGIAAVARGRRSAASPVKSILSPWSLPWSALATGCGLLAAAFLTGAALAVTAAFGGVTPSPIREAHIGAGYAAAATAAVFLIARTFPWHAPFAGSQRDPGGVWMRAAGLRWARGDGLGNGRRFTPGACAALVGLLLVGLLAGSAAIPSSETLDAQYQPDEYYADLTATNARQAKNPLFPAGTTVVVEPGARVRSSAYCGSAGCHPNAYREWLGSAHQQADSDPIYRQEAALFEAQHGQTARRWCEGCHGPVAMANQGFGVPVFKYSGVQVLGRSGVRGKETASGRSSDLNTRTPEHRNTSAGQEGVNCLTCHATARVTELSGNGRFELRVPTDYPFAADPDPRRRWLHDFLLRLRPGPHRLAFMRAEPGSAQSWLGQSEFCSSCHRMSYNLPQNDYKFLRTEDEYGTWQAGPASGQSIHDFFPPGPARQCQDCHDPHRGGGIGYWVLGIGCSGRYPTPNTQYPTPNRPPVTVDILALRRSPRAPGAPETLIAPLDQVRPLLQRGETVTVDVVVRNRSEGHEFPAGVGNREAWLEFAVLDGMGRTLLRSGGTGAHGDSAARVPGAGAHTYGLVGLDRHGCPLTGGDLWNMVAPLYYRSILPGQPDTDRRTIQPGESDVVRYRVCIPAAAAGPLQLRARLWSRNSVARGQWSVVSFGQGRPIFDVAALTTDHGLRATASSLTPANSLIAEDSVTLALAAQPASPPLLRPSAPHPPLPNRLYDYGVGLLLQGDLPRAMRAMRQVQALAPRDVQGYLGLGRVYLTEGDLLAARAQFEQARQIAPGDPRPRAFLAATERRMGEYDTALALLQPLARAYPRDKQLWFDIGMSHYLSGRYEEASRAFTRMLDIDPDDLAAHYELMRSLRCIHRVPEARHEEVIYQTLREDDNARRIERAYLRTHPLADRETRTVHEHPLLAVMKGVRSGKGTEENAKTRRGEGRETE